MYKSFLPEIFLSMSILFQLIYNIRIINNVKYNFPIIDKEVFYQTIFILVCVFLIYNNLKIESFFSNFLFVNNEATKIIKMIVLVICFLTLNIIMQSFAVQSLNFFEFFIIFLLSLLSLLLLVGSSDLMSFYLLIEMQSLCFYILASFKRNSSFSSEAGLKYFISGAFISVIFLFGASLLYGCLGTLNFNALLLLLAFPIKSVEMHSFIFLSILCITVTLLFKIACAPFHFWAPDVYEGSPLSSTIIFSIIPKISLIFFFIKWLYAINIFFFEIKYILLICGILSAFVGTFFALSQKRLKKLIIYSSISQIGFVVAGLSINSITSNASVLFFLIIYIITSILIWSHFSLFYDFQSRINTFNNKNTTSLFISSLTNFFKKNKVWAFSFVIIFFSIGGIPPLTGFFAKIVIIYEIIADIISNTYINTFAATLLMIISSISIFYYIRVIKTMFFEPKHNDKRDENFQTIFHDEFLDRIYTICAFLLLLLLLIFYKPSLLLLFCQYIILIMENFK